MRKTTYELRIVGGSSNVCSSDLILAGFDVWRFTPVWLHWAALVGFTAAFGAALWQGLRMLRWPGEGDATRRPERSEERRVGKEGVSTCSSWWPPDHKKTKHVHNTT